MGTAEGGQTPSAARTGMLGSLQMAAAHPLGQGGCSQGEQDISGVVTPSPSILRSLGILSQSGFLLSDSQHGRVWAPQSLQPLWRQGCPLGMGTCRIRALL